MAQTVTSKLLLGFMDEDEALANLTREMVPPMSKADALALWRDYKKRREKVQGRDCAHKPLELTDEEKDWAAKHMATHKANRSVLGVVKVDASLLAAHQFSVVTDISDGYQQRINDPVERIKLTLGIGLNHKGRIPKAKKERGIIKKRIPHFEYTLYRFTTDDDLLVQEQERFVSVMEFATNRKVLWAGYHRTHSLVACSKPEDTERLLLGTLVSDDTGFLGMNSTLPHRRSVVRGDAPALIADFFDPDLCMTVTSRKRRWEIHADPRTGAWKYEQFDVE